MAVVSQKVSGGGGSMPPDPLRKYVKCQFSCSKKVPCGLTRRDPSYGT